MLKMKKKYVYLFFHFIKYFKTILVNRIKLFFFKINFISLINSEFYRYNKSSDFRIKFKNIDNNIICNSINYNVGLLNFFFLNLQQIESLRKLLILLLF